MRLFRHRGKTEFFAPDVEPSIDLTIPILHVSGLNNYVVPRPASLKLTSANRATAVKRQWNRLYGSFMGNDFRAAYVPVFP